MGDNRPVSLIDRAEALVLALIQEDRIGVPEQVDKVLRALLEHLRAQDLNAEQALKKAGVKGGSIWGMFRSATGWSLADYIKLRRIQMATYLLHYSSFTCTAIGHHVGWLHFDPFNRACKMIHKELYGHLEVKPGDVRKAGPEVYPARPSSRPPV